MFTMDLPKFIVSNQKEKSISALYMYKGFKMPMAVNLSLLSGPVVVFDANIFFKIFKQYKGRHSMGWYLCLPFI